MRMDLNDDWWESNKQRLKYRAKFRDYYDNEEFGFLGWDENDKNSLHFRTLDEKGEFWSQPKEDFLYLARQRGFQLTGYFPRKCTSNIILIVCLTFLLFCTYSGGHWNTNRTNQQFE